MNGNKANILGVNLDSSSAGSLPSTIVNLATNGSNGNTPVMIFTPNPEFVAEAQKDQGFKDLLNKADINLPDGVGLVYAGKVLGQPIIQRVSGADVVERLLEEGNEKKWSVGVAGARKGALSEISKLFQELKTKYPNINFINLDSKFLPCRQAGLILDSRFNVVFAAHGMRKQEQWIWENKDKIKTNVFMGVGGSLDFLTGFSQRAPVSIRKIGLEWLWRAVQRPSHFKRVWRATIIFGGLVVRKKLSLVFGLNSK